MTRTFWLLCLICFNFSSCKKEEEKPSQLPPETQEGNNTFGFLLNGVVWLPKDPPYNFNGFQKLQSFYNDSIFELHAGRKSNPNSYFYLDCEKISQDSIIVFNNYSREKNITLLEAYYSNGNTPDSTFEYFSVQNHQITLYIKKLDKVNHIVAGTFEGQLIDTVKSKIVNITNGRFDIKY